MTIRPNTFITEVGRCVIALLAASLCAEVVPAYGFSQKVSDHVNKLIEQLKSPDIEARYSAVYALGQMGGEAKGAAPALIAALKDKGGAVNIRAAIALKQIGAEAVPALLGALRDNDLYTRANAAEVLGQMGDKAKEAVPALIAALKDYVPYSRNKVKDALALIGAAAVPALVAALGSNVSDIRGGATDVLALIGAAAVPALISALKDKDPGVRSRAADALARMGTSAKEAVPALITALNDKSHMARNSAAFALGQIGAEAIEAVAALIAALKDQESGVRSRAAVALGRIGTESKDAVPALIAALHDENEGVRESGAEALGAMGARAKEAVSPLIAALQDEDSDVREEAAKALGRMGAEAKEAVPALIVALKDKRVRGRAAIALSLISKGLFDARSTAMLPQLKQAYASLKDSPDRDVSGQAVEVKRTIDYFESLGWIGSREKAGLWIIKHSALAGVTAGYLFLVVFWLLLFLFRPLWLLPVSTFVSDYEVKIKWPIDMGLPLRHLLLVSLFHYRNRVLDRWVQKHLSTARENFAERQTVKQRKTYVSTPTMTNEEICDSLSPVIMQSFFDRPKSTLLISGEGGAGKTSLACQMAVWAMEDESESRLCKSHRMLPVLIEGTLEPQADGKSAFIEIIRGHLRELIGEPDEIPEEFLLQLLRKRRVLVIVDSLSELDEVTRRIVRPAQPDFPMAALIVTSRIDDILSGAAKTIIKPLRLNKDRLSFFMDRYLEQRGKQFQTDEELFESCRNLSQLIGERDITALIAKMYAELKIASIEQPPDFDLPRNLPDLMQGYAVNINESVKADRKETRAVLDAAKAVAWECLRKSCRPAPAKRDDVLKALRKEASAEAMLEYLEDRLQLIQTTGAAKDSIRFSLDPLAEYLASLHLVEHCNNSVSRWQEITDLLKAQPGAPELIKGFLLALEDCCKHHGQEHGVPGSVIEAINQLLQPAPAAAASAD